MQKHIKNWLYSRGKLVDDFFFCEKCGQSTDTMLHIHHIKFRSDQGTDDADNLIMLCEECHKKAQKRAISDEVLFAVAKRFILK